MLNYVEMQKTEKILKRPNLRTTFLQKSEILTFEGRLEVTQNKDKEISHGHKQNHGYISESQFFIHIAKVLNLYCKITPFRRSAQSQKMMIFRMKSHKDVSVWDFDFKKLFAFGQ